MPQGKRLESLLIRRSRELDREAERRQRTPETETESEPEPPKQPTDPEKTR